MRFVKKHLVRISLLLVLGLAVFAVTRYRLHQALVPGGEMVAVKVTGHVKRPGLYQVPRGTTKFALLKMAGVFENSDLRLIQVSETVEKDQDVSVGVGKVVGVKEQSTIGWARVNFFLGAAALLDSAGQKIPAQVNQPIPFKSAVQTGSEGQCEVLLSDASTFTLWPGSQAVVSKVSALGAAGVKETEIVLSKGRLECVARPQGGGQFVFVTPHARVLIKGTELAIRVTPDQSLVRVSSGFVEVRRLAGNAAVNLVGGQFTAVSSDTTTPLAVRYTTEESPATKDTRKIFEKEKQNFLAKNRTHKILYVGNPNFFLFLNIDPAAKTISLSRLSGEYNIADIVDGFDRLNQAFLFGGAQFTVSICERVFKTKLDNYLVQDVEDVRLTLSKIGNVSVPVDPKAAQYLALGAGLNSLDPDHAVKFMSPAISGLADAALRQNLLLEAIFKQLNDRKLQLSPIFVEAILQGGNSDLDAKEVMEIYKTFSLSTDWVFKILKQG